MPRKSDCMEVRASHILVHTEDKAKWIAGELHKGADFAVLARQYSQCPSKMQGGDLGFFEPGVMPEAIDRMVFSLAVGQLSRVVQSPYGFHIFKVLGRQQAGSGKFPDVKERLIADLRKLKEAEAYQSWIDGLKARADIRIHLPLAGASPAQTDTGSTGSKSAGGTDLAPATGKEPKPAPGAAPAAVPKKR